MNKKSSRTYENLWEKIKDNKNIYTSVECNTHFVSRIKRGVIKEKSQDDVFKELNTVENFFLDIIIEKVEDKTSSSIIKFKLKSKFGLTDAVNGTLVDVL